MIKEVDWCFIPSNRSGNISYPFLLLGLSKMLLSNPHRPKTVWRHGNDSRFQTLYIKM